MAEGSETSGGGLGPDLPAGGAGPEGRARGGEADLLSERRARRAAGSGEHVLERRAEAAEATMRTLETHVASLQLRLREANEERMRMSALIAAEHAAPAAPLAAGEPQPRGEQPPPGAIVEHELRRLKQSEFAEQRQRVEAEARIAAVERESGADVERLRRRLSDSESEAGMLAGRLEQLRRELAEAEHSMAAERSALRRAEAELQARVAEFERRSAAAGQELESERAARARTEHALELARAGHRRLEALVEELKAAGVGLRAAISKAAEAGPDRARPGEPPAAREPAVGEARAAAPPGVPVATGSPVGEAATAREPEPQRPAAPHADVQRQAGAQSAEMVDALAAAVERLRARVAETPARVPRQRPRPPRHKHSMSLIGRVRMARKQRRQR